MQAGLLPDGYITCCLRFVGLLTARYLGPSNFGLINYAATYTSFFASFCTLGINSVIVKNFVDHPDEEGETVGSAIVLRTVSSVLSVLMMVCITLIADKERLRRILWCFSAALVWFSK